MSTTYDIQLHADESLGQAAQNMASLGAQGYACVGFHIDQASQLCTYVMQKVTSAAPTVSGTLTLKQV